MRGPTCRTAQPRARAHWASLRELNGRATAADGGARQLNQTLETHSSTPQWKLQRNATQGLPIGTNARRKAVAAPLHHCRLATQLLIPPSLRPNLSLDLPLSHSQPCSAPNPARLHSTTPGPIASTRPPTCRRPERAKGSQREPRGSQREHYLCALRSWTSNASSLSRTTQPASLFHRAFPKTIGA